MARATLGQGVLLASLAGLAGLVSAAPADSASDTPPIPAVKTIGTLPPPPPHQWADPVADVNDNRVAGNGLVSAPALTTYLNGLYANIKAAAGVPDWPGAVYISSDTTLNAHASASGNLYLHMGLIRSAETEDEIYGVLAHEFAHVYLNHQAAYEAHEVASNVATGAKALFSLFKKKLPGADMGWNAFDSVGLVDGVMQESLIPVWQREVEEQADMFAATLTLRERYSYPAGLKTFLERLASIEQQAPQGQPGAAVTGAAAAPDGKRKTHATAREREDVLTAQMLPLIPRPRPAPRKAKWQAAVRDKDTAQLLAHFALAPEIDRLEAAGRSADALKLAQTAASGSTAGDATMLLVLQDAMRQAGAGMDDQRAVLLRNRAWPERSWAVQYQAAAMIAPQQIAFAKDFLKEQYAYFKEAPRTWPDMIGFYFRTGDAISQAPLSAQCFLDARFRAACADRAQTDAQRQQAAVAQANRQQQQLDRFQQKLNEKFHLKQ